MPIEISSSWYRTSVKWLIYNKEDKILLCKEVDGRRDLPGWWLDWGEEPKDGLKREMKEEMGLEVMSIEKQPSSFCVRASESKLRPRRANVYYKVTVKDLHFTPSDECIDIWFFDHESIKEVDAFPNVVKVFDELFA